MPGAGRPGPPVHFPLGVDFPVRRLSLAMALLLAILAGSLGGFCLAGRPELASACCQIEAPACPKDCRVPGRAPGPEAPCHLDPATLGLALSAPLRTVQFQGHPHRVEPSPMPAALQRGPARDLAEAGLARLPSRSLSRGAPPGTDPLALLRVFRI